MNNDLNNFTGGDAEKVQHQASQFDPDQVATIQWLGYDTPEGATALGDGAAEPGAEALPQFVAGIRAQRTERLHWTVVAHSYGSLVTGMARIGAGPRGRRDGVRRARRASASTRPTTSATATSGSASPTAIPSATPGGSAPTRTARAFGATRFHTGDISGHSSYFNEGSESLRNIGLITAGYLDEVNVNDGLF